MPIQSHPGLGRIVVCDFDQGFRVPEMVKRRPCVIVAPKISVRAGLCTVVPLSTTKPEPLMSYHCRLELERPLPPPWDSEEVWVKADMVNSVAFHRIDLVRTGKDGSGKRTYYLEAIPDESLRCIRICILCSLGLAALKSHV